MNSTEACIALNMIRGMGPVRLRRLLDVFGSPERILLARASQLREVENVGPETADSIARWEETVDLPAELRRIADFGARVLTLDSPDYPTYLREIHDPPIALYIWGAWTERDRTGIGVVGSRQSSHYGTESAKKLSYQLAYAGVTIISGLARGIDTAAHLGALAAQGRTVAVLGAGFHHLYPPENRALAEKIVENGALISEFSMEVEPDRQTFPMRNRIISGMSRGVLVVEAGANSGALISANQAIDQGRNVYALPGQIDRPTSIGSNRLIQQGAKLVTSASDILQDLDLLIPEEPVPRHPAPRSGQLAGDEKTVFEALGETEISLDDLVAKSSLPSHKVTSSLLTLEMRRLVKRLPGQYFIRIS